MTSALVGARTTAQLSDTLKNHQNLAFSLSAQKCLRRLTLAPKTRPDV
jgi:hypothetical protein